MVGEEVSGMTEFRYCRIRTFSLAIGRLMVRGDSIIVVYSDGMKRLTEAAMQASMMIFSELSWGKGTALWGLAWMRR